MSDKREYTEAEINELVEKRSRELLAEALKRATPQPQRRDEMTSQQKAEFISKNGVDAYKALPA